MPKLKVEKVFPYSPNGLSTTALRPCDEEGNVIEHDVDEWVVKAAKAAGVVEGQAKAREKAEAKAKAEAQK